jgi:NADH dehydrogenase/NADH:ubiquinone oxidoreductase subunit G
MLRQRSFLLILSTLVIFAFPSSLLAQEEHRSETKVQVPSLDKFHTVIYRLWHDAWPKKDTEALIAILPEIEKNVADVSKASLPGILREKKPSWDTNIKKLQEIAGEYKAAVEARDSMKLLGAAEKLHGQYEALVRIVRPVMKELAEFHAELYMLYHYYMPEYKLEQMKTSAAALKEKMAALDKATLPARLKGKQDEFQAAREKLSAAVDELHEILKNPANDQGRTNAAIYAVHGNYQVLERLFD